MNLISSLWIAAGICAMLLAADGLLTRFLPGRRTGPVAGPRLIAFSVLMTGVGIGCIILGLYEATT